MVMGFSLKKDLEEEKRHKRGRKKRREVKKHRQKSALKNEKNYESVNDPRKEQEAKAGQRNTGTSKPSSCVS